MSFNQSRYTDATLPCVSISWLVLLPLVALFSNQALAHDEHAKTKKTPPKQQAWSGSGKLGFTSNAGNTNTEKLKGSARVVYNKNFNREKPFRHTFGASINKGSNARTRDGERSDTTDKEAANYKTDYFLSDRSSARVFGFYISDKKAKIDSLTMMGIGYEYDLLKTKKHSVNLSGGISSFKLEYNDGTTPIEGPAARLAFTYNGQLTKNISLNQRLVGLSTDGLTMKTSNTSLQYAFTKRTSVSLDHEVTKYSSIADTAIDDTDDSTSLNLVFKF